MDKEYLRSIKKSYISERGFIVGLCKYLLLRFHATTGQKLCGAYCMLRGFPVAYKLNVNGTITLPASAKGGLIAHCIITADGK